MGFYKSQVVQDFFHQQYQKQMSREFNVPKYMGIISEW